MTRKTLLGMGLSAALLIFSACTVQPEMAGAEAEREKVSTFTGTVGDSALKLYTNKVEMLAYRMTDLANALAAGTEYADAYDATSEAVSSMISGYNSIN